MLAQSSPGSEPHPAEGGDPADLGADRRLTRVPAHVAETDLILKILQEAREADLRGRRRPTRRGPAAASPAGDTGGGASTA